MTRFTSDAPKLARVQEFGPQIQTGDEEGDARITATVRGISATTTVHVKKP